MYQKNSAVHAHYFNVLTPEEHQYCVDNYILGDNWSYKIWSRDDDSDMIYRFWTIFLSEDPFILKVFDPKVRALCNLPEEDYELVRVFANGQTNGNPAQFHIDDEGTDTFLYYCNPEWNAEWGGLTIFDNEGMLEYSFPYPNSGIHFDALVPHYGQEPHKGCPTLRTTIAFKYKKRNQ
jgi:hypothetical protein